MSYNRAEGILLKYLYFLQEKNVIKDYKIEKQLARSLYMDEFKPKFKIERFSFSTLYSVMLEYGIVRRVRKGTTIQILEFNKSRFHYSIRYFLGDLKEDNEPSKENNASTSQQYNKNAVIKNMNALRCYLCNYTFANEALLNRHNNSKKHLVLLQCISKTSTTSGVIMEVKNGYGGDTETLIIPQNEKSTIVLHIVNKSSVTYFIQNIVKITKSTSVNYSNLKLPHKLLPGTNLDMTINAEFKEPMYLTYPIKLTIVNSENTPFDVVKTLVFHVHNNILNDLHPTQPYKEVKTQLKHDSNYEVVPGVYLQTDMKSASPIKIKLPNYLLPQYMVVLLDHQFKEYPDITSHEVNMLKHLLKIMATFHKGSLDSKNYFNISQLRLYMEEYQMKINIHLYDVENQTLQSVRGFPNNFLELSVPGLAEHRPSLLKGDTVLLQEGKATKLKYEGIVHKVNQSSVVLGFDHRFSENVHMNNKKYSVSFTFNRLPLRAEHQAINLARDHDITPILCSSGITTRSLNSYDIVWYNSDISENKNQQTAIRHILSETARPLPYLIFGPPGTGKTVTVVEAILQIRFHKPNSKILVCAPSNFAADEITKRLIKKNVTKMDLFRYVAPSYSYDLIDTSIKPFTNFKTEFYYPLNSELCKYHIIVSTLVTASRLINGGTPAGHFSYVFIDESGQATESETLIPIAGILTSLEKPGVISGQIVLAGDPQQLGPIIHSPSAISIGYGISMLERMMRNCGPYQKSDAGYDNGVLTKLVKSYRSHPAILELPNKLFYDGELVPPTDQTLTHIAIGWEKLPNQNFPVIFHSVIGKDDREANSPSFFNLQEIDIVISYLEDLLNSRFTGMKIQEEHIGVITPYRKQVFKLQQMCKKKKWDKIMIGSVEQFQGQEKLIIIVSTVRSRPEFTVHDEKFHLGFLRNYKRFNVALTRAKALLIVIGNPNILLCDDTWKAFIQYCVENNATTGTPFDLSSASTVAPAIAEEGEEDGEHVQENANFSRGNV